MVGRARGFTLIELLVVLLLMGIVVSFAVLSLGDERGREMETETRRLAALLELASEEAVLQSMELGVRFEASGYSFLVLGSEGWSPIADELLRERRLPDGLKLGLLLEGLPVALDEKTDPPVEPQIFLYSSGERTPFEARVEPELDAGGWRLEAPLVGDLIVSRVEG